EDVTFALLASDGVVGESGAFDLLPSDVEPTDTGAWIDIEEEVALAAGESAVVPFTITVPEDALPGDHPGGIVASLSTAASGAARCPAGRRDRRAARDRWREHADRGSARGAAPAVRRAVGVVRGLAHRPARGRGAGDPGGRRVRRRRGRPGGEHSVRLRVGGAVEPARAGAARCRAGRAAGAAPSPAA